MENNHYYKCSGAKRKLGCKKKAIRKNWIEDVVVNPNFFPVGDGFGFLVFIRDISYYILRP